MSETTHEPSATKPVAEHAWLQNLVGTWKVTTEMQMGPDQPIMTGHGTEEVVSLNGLWAYTKGEGTMPDGDVMHYFMTLGYDVNFKEYRGAWFADVSSHLWNYVGELSADGKVMTLNCEGPDMEVEGKTAMYRDIHEIIDGNTRTLTAMFQVPSGEWVLMMKSTLTRIG